MRHMSKQWEAVEKSRVRGPTKPQINFIARKGRKDGPKVLALPPAGLEFSTIPSWLVLDSSRGQIGILSHCHFKFILTSV